MSSNETKVELAREAESTIRTTISELLETKHLYQSVTVDFSKVRSLLLKLEQEIFRCDYEVVSNSNNRLPGAEQVALLKQKIHENVAGKVQHWIDDEWILVDEKSAAAFGNDSERIYAAMFSLPSVKIFCSKCNSGPWPHNPAREPDAKGFSFESSVENPNIQVFSIPFQCQNCNKESRTPLVFFIRRDGLKLTLVGRSQFPETQIPNFIPSAQRKFYRNAIVSDQTSFSLAAALYLRVLIEQYFYAVIPLDKIKEIKGNPTGDELADLYTNTLPKNFPSNFPSLKKAYADLSVIIHSGKEDDEVKKSFSLIRSSVDGHFKAIQLFKEIPLI